MQNVDELCHELHVWANSLPVYRFPFDVKLMPQNGIYLLFEKGEIGHGTNRIVRVGTHTGQNQLRSRLEQHFVTENKDRSIFRKNIGRALLRKRHDDFLVDWEIDLTSADARAQHLDQIDRDRTKEVERDVSHYMQENFSFVVVPIESKEQRLWVESQVISTVSRCCSCRPSGNWLGNYSTKEKIRKSGLWLVNELYKDPLTRKNLDELVGFLAKSEAY